MSNNEEMIADARKMALIDRESREPVVRAMQVLADALEQADHELAQLRVREGQANYLLARLVAAANISAIEGADGFIERYDMPVGPIHKAIPFLAEQGIVVTYDGQILNGPDALKSTPTPLVVGEPEREADVLHALVSRLWGQYSSAKVADAILAAGYRREPSDSTIGENE